MNSKVFTVISSLNKSGGGVTQVILNRSSSFARAGLDASIVIFSDPHESREIESYYREQNQLDKKVKWLDIFSYYRDQNSIDHVPVAKKIDSFIYRLKLYNLKPFATYTKKHIHSDDGKLKRVDYHDKKGVVFKQKFLHPDGFIEQVNTLKKSNGAVVTSKFFTSDGFCFAKINNRKIATYHYSLYKRDAAAPILFTHRRAFRQYFLEEICQKETTKPIMICDGKQTMPTLLGIKKGLAHMIYHFHSNYFKSPHTPGSEIKPHQSVLLKRLSDVDKLVVLTEGQKQDVIDQFGHSDKIIAIPNQYRQPNQVEVEKNLKQIAIIARMSGEKRVHHAIIAFADVVKEVPDAKLVVCGDGDKRSFIEKQIKDLGLEDSVTLRGHIPAVEIDKVFKSSLCCLLTSAYEGFSLSAVESSINYTPMVAYDIKYGPSDIIVDGKTGYLVKSLTPKEMSEKIIHLLKNPTEAIKAGQAAHDRVQANYSEEIITKKWLDLFANL